MSTSNEKGTINKNRKKFLGVSTIGLLTAAAVVTSLRGMATIAKEEMTMFVYLGFAAIFYLIPAALVSAELGGTFANRKGGVFVWVAEAFGKRWGFLSIWLQWVQNVVWYPITLTFGAVALAYTIGRPDLASNHIYIGIFCIVVYWLATLVATRGVRVFAKISNWGFFLGTVVPGVVLLGLLVYWLASGHPIGWQQLTTTALEHAGHARFWPEIKGLSTIAFLASILLLFAGIEVQGVHVLDMEKPRKQFPVAIGIAAAISLGLYIVGALPIAAIMPYDKINLTTGVFATYSAVFKDILNAGWLVNVLALLVGVGVIGGVFAWIGSPARGLLATAEEGELPPTWQKVNKNNMPTNILFVQGIIVTVISALYFIMKDVEVGFFLISAMTIALYLIMYMFMYAAVVKLRYSKPDLNRPFVVPGGKFGLWLIAGIGFLAMVFSFIISFFPPSQLPVGSPLTYTLIVIVSTIVFSIIPLIIHAVRKPTWKKTTSDADS
jgi:glutamate:GABA antiporter